MVNWVVPRFTTLGSTLFIVAKLESSTVTTRPPILIPSVSKTDFISAPVSSNLRYTSSLATLRPNSVPRILLPPPAVVRTRTIVSLSPLPSISITPLAVSSTSLSVLSTNTLLICTGPSAQALGG